MARDKDGSRIRGPIGSCMATRILHVLTGSDQAGAVTQLALLAPGLTRAGFDVRMCVLSSRHMPPSAWRALAGPLTVIRRSGAFDPLALVRLRQHVRRVRPALVHTWQFPWTVFGRAALAGGRAPCLVQWEPTGGGWPATGNLLGRWQGGWSQRTVVTCSQRGQALMRGGLPPGSLAVIPYAAPLTRGTAEARHRLRQELGVPSHARLIAATGPLVPESRLKDLIWTVDLLKVLYNDVHLVIVGQGPQRSRLQRFCRQTDVADRVHLLGDRPNLSRLLSCVDCFWSGSSQPEQAGAILSAMGAAVPVIAARGPVAQELVRPEQTGYLYPLGNCAVLVRRTKGLLDDALLARRLGEAGRAAIADRFRTDVMIARYVSLYGELLAATTHAGGGR